MQGVMARVYAKQGLGRCATYAIVGAQVLTRVLERPYQAVCGGQVLDCGRGIFIVFYPTREQRRRARQLSDLSDYHCWIEAYRASPGGGAQRREVVDFAARHDPASAALVGIPFERPEPDFVWGWADVLDRQFPDSLRNHPDMRSRKPTWLWADPQLTGMLDQMACTQPDYYRRLVEAVIADLGQLTASMQVLDISVMSTGCHVLAPDGGALPLIGEAIVK
jgi:hypothetical protein